MNLGYACINMELNARKGVDRVTTNRSMIKKTFQEKGLDYASELIIQNVVDLNEIIDWNEQNDIKFFRMSSDVFEFMGLSRTPYNKLNIHCNGVYGDKESAMDRFCKNFELLPESVQTRLTVENDDKASMYSVKDLYEGIHKRIGIPIVFDYHHFKFNTGGQTEQEALELAMSTWPDNIIPVVHYSESKAEHQLDESIRPQAHSDIINELPNTYGKEVDVMVEAKHKELAIQPFIENSYET